MPNVSHPKSLTTNFNPPAQIQHGPNAQPGHVGDHAVQMGPPPRPRATQALKGRQRFANRAKRVLGNMKAGLPQRGNRKDRIKSQKSDRFNARLEKFSDRVETGVAQLSQAGSKLANRKESLLTLHNDMKLLAADHPQADKFDVLSARLDVELDKLSDEQLDNFRTNVADKLDKLSGRKLANSRFGDQIEVLQLMLSASVRHLTARSPGVSELIGNLNTDNPSDISQRTNVRDQAAEFLGVLQRAIGESCGLRGAALTRHAEHALGKAIQIRLQRDGASPAEIANMNRNLLNIAEGLRSDVIGDGTVHVSTRDTEINTLSRPLRLMNRAIRDSYLHAKVGQFHDENVTTRYKKLGSGAAHTVTKLNYRDVETTKVYKADDDTIIHDRYGRPDIQGNGRYCAPIVIGIDQSSPRLLERAVVTSKFADKLGWEIVAKTDYASHNGEVGIIQDLARGRLGGTQGLFRSAMDANKASLQQQMTQLHLLDLITGQGDRHRNNYMISVEGDQVKVTGIDSDFCMGPKISDPKSLFDGRSCHLPGMPNVVDSAMYHQVLQLDEAKIRELCGSEFSDATITATIDRVESLKTHLRDLERDGKVIHPTQWGDPATDLLLANDAGRTASLTNARAEFADAIPGQQTDVANRLADARNAANNSGLLEEFNRFVDRRGSKRFTDFAESRSVRRLDTEQRQQMIDALKALQTAESTLNRSIRKRDRSDQLQQSQTVLQQRVTELETALRNAPSERQSGNIKYQLACAQSDLQDLHNMMHLEFGIEIPGYYSREMLKETPEGLSFLQGI